jgi:hypothetical protein
MPAGKRSVSSKARGRFINSILEKYVNIFKSGCSAYTYKQIVTYNKRGRQVQDDH